MEDFKPPRKLDTTQEISKSDGVEVFTQPEATSKKRSSVTSIFDSEDSDGEDAQRMQPEEEERTYDSDSELDVRITRDVLEDIIHAWLDANAMTILKKAMAPTPKRKAVAKGVKDCLPKKAKK